MPNIVYIATSLDGYIADAEGGLDWLHDLPNPEQSDFGFANFMNGIDALVMGRVTFETVCGFDVDWPYNKPVFVLSRTLESVPDALTGLAEVVHGSLAKVSEKLHGRGLHRLYIDGGKTVQSFLAQDRIDELIVTRFPLLLGGGTPLFGPLTAPLAFEHLSTEVLAGALVQSHYRRKR
jgi:dihydrofolate reductase